MIKKKTWKCSLFNCETISAQTEELPLTSHRIQQYYKVTNNFDFIIYQSPGVWIVGAGGGTVA